MEVKVFKLISGEEMIARVEESLTGEVTIKNARVMQVMQDPASGQVRAALAPYFMVAPNCSFPINLDTVVGSIPCPADVEKMYLEQTSEIKLIS